MRFWRNTNHSSRFTGPISSSDALPQRLPTGELGGMGGDSGVTPLTTSLGVISLATQLIAAQHQFPFWAQGTPLLEYADSFLWQWDGMTRHAALAGGVKATVISLS